LITAKKIVELGVEDPRLFILLPLLEYDVGPDRISDMVTRIIFPELAEYTFDIANNFDVPMEEYKFDGNTYSMPSNPTGPDRIPVILIPKDVLSKLPVASDWSEVADAACRNAEIRQRVNRYIGNIWQSKYRKDKEKLKQNVLSSRESVESLLSAIQIDRGKPYNFGSDPESILVWRFLLKTVAKDFPFQIKQEGEYNLDLVAAIVGKINEQFTFLIEDRGLAKLLWRDRHDPHHERVSQMIYFAVADSYCKANDLDITPEADTGTGAVDFKFSHGYDSRVLVEIKLSTNQNIVDGYEKQLSAYAKSERTMRATYIVIDVGRMGTKDQKILKIRDGNRASGKPTSDIIFVDGSVKPSASKRK
jgi:hypothetical protein